MGVIAVYKQAHLPLEDLEASGGPAEPEEHTRVETRAHYQHPIPGLEMGRSTLHDALSSTQFHHVNNESFHSLIAKGPGGDFRGSLMWSKPSANRVWEPGEISYVGTKPDLQRKGLATAMIETARNLGIQPAPQHSASRTAEGNAWSASVGGTRPRHKPA